MKSFLQLENTKKIANKKQNNGAGPNLLLFRLIKLQLPGITNFPCIFFLQFFPSIFEKKQKVHRCIFPIVEIFKKKC